MQASKKQPLVVWLKKRSDSTKIEREPVVNNEIRTNNIISD